MKRIRVNCGVFIAGAGPAGIAAAISAAREGADVILCERYGGVGGGLVTNYVRPILGYVKNPNIGDEIVKRLSERDPMTSTFEFTKYCLTKMLDEAGVRVFLQTQVTGAKVNGGRIEYVTGVSHSVEYEFTARQYIDATGDGDLAELCGCETVIGREGDRLVQPATIMFTIDGISPDDGLYCCHEEDYRQLSDGNEYLALCHEACANGELPPSINIVRLYDIGKKGERMVNATQYNHIDPLDPEAIFKAEAELREQMMTCVKFLRKHVPGFENVRITGSGTSLGVRESRRVIGDYILTGEDLVVGRKFDDAIVHGANFSIDIHNPDGAGQSETDGCPHVAKNYDIPYRSICPIGLSNLLTAGRCISGDHRAHASYRVMRICMAIGNAAGLASAMAVKSGDTRNIDLAGLIRRLDTKEE